MKKHPAITTVKECLPGLMSFTLWLALRLTPAAAMPATNAPTAIPWNEIGAQASANYHGDGLAVMPAGSGTRLHCVFQRLDGEATPEGVTALEPPRVNGRILREHGRCAAGFHRGASASQSAGR